MKLHFTIRDLLWLTALVAMVLFLYFMWQKLIDVERDYRRQTHNAPMHFHD